jgi:hypothetical protein
MLDLAKGPRIIGYNAYPRLLRHYERRAGPARITADNGQPKKKKR